VLALVTGIWAITAAQRQELTPPGNKCSELPGYKQVWANENWGEKSWRLFFIAIEITFEMDMLATFRATDSL
jgi:hypothetical protein